MYDVYVFVLGFTVSVELSQFCVESTVQVVNTLFQDRNIPVINSSVVISELNYAIKHVLSYYKTMEKLSLSNLLQLKQCL